MVATRKMHLLTAAQLATHAASSFLQNVSRIQSQDVTVGRGGGRIAVVVVGIRSRPCPRAGILNDIKKVMSPLQIAQNQGEKKKSERNGKIQPRGNNTDSHKSTPTTYSFLSIAKRISRTVVAAVTRPSLPKYINSPCPTQTHQKMATESLNSSKPPNQSSRN
jgi:hypothetical protein